MLPSAAERVGPSCLQPSVASINLKLDGSTLL
ncbi:hypothetical protein EHW99_1380 [Erwinia amylovora]|uniref:Uncharacterized protein n=2 Tax=Erwinia amylovora TaxID=552 RepID=A0A831ER57_ERWAM|nr:hypothetical protein EaACW_2221 [Erwinia amylovora ACW56400]QJQ54085.1 hypothetical protein EHX00_1380 [Erwinia amylovora]CBA21273.1 hypothetical protein predicted by Glimmer/Critica [Erwinia amylovora CFBP1430]CCO79065.1 hypothetical protein BN432_2277 [Erwinia amylovora Ea356]CCO82870.1 hypothetical protein BN433_2309 [Erwinia amylovora Ea266]CCO86641.1 hypothetical protein BN434_2262 [Erwinia amylovora CFBP 2585]CCO90430.1 hypothetical protein BN435_2270 [Erwinia amylovora 01SFR-BO]CCO